MQLRKLLLSSLTNRCKCNWLWACPKFFLIFFPFRVAFDSFSSCATRRMRVFWLRHPSNQSPVCVCVCLYAGSTSSFSNKSCHISRVFPKCEKNTHQRWPRLGEGRYSRAGRVRYTEWLCVCSYFFALLCSPIRLFSLLSVSMQFVLVVCFLIVSRIGFSFFFPRVNTLTQYGYDTIDFCGVSVIMRPLKGVGNSWMGKWCNQAAYITVSLRKVLDMLLYDLNFQFSWAN